MGLTAMLASGWSGQTTENFAAASVYAPGVSGLGNDLSVPSDPVAEVVGVRIPSYVNLHFTYRLGRQADR